jgi:hypothetical protein
MELEGKDCRRPGSLSDSENLNRPHRLQGKAGWCRQVTDLELKSTLPECGV